MAKLVKVHSSRAKVFLAITVPDGQPDYTDLYKQLRGQTSIRELPQLEGDAEKAAKDMESAYVRLKSY